jgi:methyl-accepting chemotaxis protein
LYPGLDQHGAHVEGGEEGQGGKFDGEKLNQTLGQIGEGITGLSNLSFDTSSLETQNQKMIDSQSKMVTELQTMAKSMSSLQALQSADFSEIERLTKGAGKFTAALNDAVTSIVESLDETKVYREQLVQLNQNMQSLNNVYGGVLVAMRGSK